MKNLFLKAKHWQLFVLMFGLPVFFQIFNIIIIASSNTNGNSETPFVLFSLGFFPIMMFLYIGLMFGWYWSIAMGLQDYIPKKHRLTLKKYKIFFFIPLIYILSLVSFIGTSFLGGLPDNVAMESVMSKLIFLIIPLHLFSMFCMFYQMYFISKTIKMVELQRSVTFSDYLGEFFMIWFLPIGIWVIQPKINNIVALNKLVQSNSSEIKV